MGGDAERLVVGFSYSMIAGIFSAGFLYLAGLLVMRFLGPRDYGLYQLVFLIPAVLAPILSFGIEITLVRFVSRFRITDWDKAVRTARFLFLVRASVGLLAFIAIMAMAPWIAKVLGEPVTPGVRVAALFLLGNMLYLFSQSLFQSFFMMKERAIIMFVHGVIYLSMVIVLIELDFGYLAPLMAFSLTSFVAVAVGFVLAGRKGIVLLPSRSREGVHVMEQLKFAAPIYVSLLLVALFAQAGVILIRLVGLDVVQVGFFRAMYNVVVVGSFMAVTLNVVVLPYVSELESKGEAEMLRRFCTIIVKLLTLFAVPASIGILILAKPILDVLLPEYVEAVMLMRILALVLLFYPVTLISNTMLRGMGRPELGLRSDLITTAIIFSLGGYLGVLHGTEGIAYSYVVGMVAGTTYSLYMLSKVVGLDIDFVVVIKISLSTTAMGIVTFLFVQLVSSPLLRMLLGIPVGIGVYLAVAFSLRTISSEELSVARKILGIARDKTTAAAKMRA